MEYFARPDVDANSRGLLAMNYEYPDFNILMAGDYDPAAASADQKAIALSAVGIGVVEVAKGSDGKWTVQAGSTYNRSEEHTSELQSLMRISYAVFCLKKKTRRTKYNRQIIYTPSDVRTPP